MVKATSYELKSALLSTWIRYDVAPLTMPQLKVGVLSLIVLPFHGEDRLTAAGKAQTVKLHVLLHPLSP